MNILIGIVSTAIVLTVFAIAGALCRMARKADQGADEDRASDDGFAQRREPEDLGEWPFTDKGQDHE